MAGQTRSCECCLPGFENVGRGGRLLERRREDEHHLVVGMSLACTNVFVDWYISHRKLFCHCCISKPPAHSDFLFPNCAADVPCCPGDTPFGQTTSKYVGAAPDARAGAGAGAGAGAEAGAGAGAGAGGFFASSALLSKLLTERRPRIKNIVSSLSNLHGHRQIY